MMLDGQKPGIDWESTVDNPIESRVGWSFWIMSAPNLQWMGSCGLYERVFKEQNLRQQFMESGSRSPKFKKDAVEAY